MPTWRKLNPAQRAKLNEMAKFQYGLIFRNNANANLRQVSEDKFVEHVRDAYKKHGGTREAPERYYEKAVDKNPPKGKKTNDNYRVIQHFAGLSMTTFYMWLEGEVKG